MFVTVFNENLVELYVGFRSILCIHSKYSDP